MVREMVVVYSELVEVVTGSRRREPANAGKETPPVHEGLLAGGGEPARHPDRQRADHADEPSRNSNWDTSTRSRDGAAMSAGRAPGPGDTCRRAETVSPRAGRARVDFHGSWRAAANGPEEVVGPPQMDR